MRQNHDMINALRADLKELSAIHAPSGSEQPVIKHLRELFTPLTDKTTVDRMGNLIASREGPQGMPHIIVSAAADEIGAVVASIETDGSLRLLPIGEVRTGLLPGHAVWVSGRFGVIGIRSSYHIPGDEHDEVTSMENLYVDVGVDSAVEVEALGVHVGDPVVVLSEQHDLGDTRVAGKGLGNRAGCVVLLHLLRRLHGRTLNCHLTAVIAVQEEMGRQGTTVAFARLKPDLAVVINTFPAAGTPDTRDNANAARIGHGVLIIPTSNSGGFGFLLPPSFREVMIAAARRAGVPYQLAVNSRKVNNATTTYLADSTGVILEVKIPCRYLHSPIEMLDLRDLTATLSMIEELVLNPPPFVEEHVTYQTMPKELSDAENLFSDIGTIIDSIQKEEQ